MNTWVVVVVAAGLATVGWAGLRQRRSTEAENAALLERIAQARRARGVDAISDIRQRRAEQIARGARPAMTVPERPDDRADWYPDPAYGAEPPLGRTNPPDPTRPDLTGS